MQSRAWQQVGTSVASGLRASVKRNARAMTRDAVVSLYFASIGMCLLDELSKVDYR